MNAYMALTSCRTEHGAVPWTAVAQYAKFYSFDLEQLDDFVFYCSELDAEYRLWEKATDPKKVGGIGKNNGNNRSRGIR